MPLMKMPVKTREQLKFLKKYDAKIVWEGGGEWIVEIYAETFGQASFRLSDGTIYNPNTALSDVMAEAATITH